MGVIAVSVTGLALAADPLTRWVAERKFDAVPDLTCTIESADLQLFERKIVLHGFRLNPEQGGAPEDMVSVDRFEIAPQGMMIRSATRSHLIFSGVHLHLERHTEGSKDQFAISQAARDALRNLGRWETDEIHVDDAQVRFIDAQTGIDLEFDGIEGQVTNLAAARQSPGEARLRWALDARAEQSAALDLRGNSHLDVDRPSFLFEGEILGAPLDAIEPLIRERLGVGVKDGYMALGFRLEGESGTFDGWLAPSFEHLEFTSPLDDDLEASLRGWGLEVAGRVIEDPVDENHDNRIEVKGQYGKHRDWSLEATKPENSWLQDRVLNVGSRNES